MSIWEKAAERMDTAWEAEGDQRRSMVEDMRFITTDDGQWEGAFREEQAHAKLTFDMISPVINGMVSEQRATRIGVSVSPKTVEATSKIADLRAGMIRAIQEDSDATDHYARAFEEAAICGFGALRVVVRYCDSEAWAQELAIEHINSACTSVFLDPADATPDGSGAMWGIIIHDYTDEEFIREFGEEAFATTAGFEANTYRWVDQDTGRRKVAEYYYKQPVTRNIGLMSDGTTQDLDENAELIAQAGLEVVKARKVKSHKVMKALVCGDKTLEAPEETPFEAIPIAPVYGVSRFIEGKRFTFGIVRKAKDPNRLINWCRSRIVEEAAYSPAQKVALPRKQIQENAADYAFLTDPSKPILPYNPDPSAPNAGLPVVIGGYQGNAGIDKLGIDAQLAMKEIIGVSSGSIDPSQTRLSGEAIGLLQGRSDNGTYFYQDNLMVAIERIGELVNMAIPEIYPEERQVFVLGEDGARTIAAINSSTPGSMTDLSIGKYKVSIEPGANFTTKRKETAQNLADLMTRDPSLIPLIGDQYVRSLDLGDGGAMYKRLRKQAISNGVIDQSEMTDDEREEMAPIIQAQQEAAQKQAQLEQIQIEIQIKAAQLELSMKEAEISKVTAEAALTTQKVTTEAAKATVSVMEAEFAAQNPQKTSVVL